MIDSSKLTSISEEHGTNLELDSEGENLLIKNKKQPWLASISELTEDLGFDDAEDYIDYADGSATKATAQNNKYSIFSPQFKVYISHFLSSWGDRMWAFAGGLFLIEITPGSLRLVAIYYAAQSLTVIILGSAIGRWVDRTKRLTAAQASLIIQNLMVCLCAILLCCLIYYGSFFKTGLNGWAHIMAQAGVIFISSVAMIGTLGSKLVIEKDWIVVISGKDSTQLSTMNSVLRTVDLSTEMLAPVLVGFIMSSLGMIVGGVFIATWNVISLFIEYGLLHYLYYNIADLRTPKQIQQSDDAGKEAKAFGVKDKIKDAALSWKKYFLHEVRNAGLSLALLYMTVLALDNYSRAYVYENGVSKAVLGILTACASFSGILGSLTFPLLLKRIGKLKTGIFGFFFELFWLTFCVIAMFAPGTAFVPSALFGRKDTSTNNTALMDENFNVSSTVESDLNNNTVYYQENSTSAEPDSVGNVDFDYTSVVLLLTGIVASRLGLWIADLTVNQILQQEVEESDRGGINGVQFSLNQSFNLLRSLLLILLPTMATFGYLVMLSYVFVFVASILFCSYAYTKFKEDDGLTSQGELGTVGLVGEAKKEVTNTDGDVEMRHGIGSVANKYIFAKQKKGNNTVEMRLGIRSVANKYIFAKQKKGNNTAEMKHGIGSVANKYIFAKQKKGNNTNEINETGLYTIYKNELGVIESDKSPAVSEYKW